MIAYIEAQGKKINKVVGKLCSFAEERRKKLTIQIDYRDYKFLKKKIKKEVNTIVEIIVLFNEKNFRYRNIKKITKNKSTGLLYLDVKDINLKVCKLLMNEKIKRYEIMMINDLDYSKLNCKNIITKNNKEDLNIFLLACGFGSKYSCKYTSCLGNSFFINKKGELSFCYKNSSKIGNIFEEEVKTLLLKNHLFNDLLMKAIKKRKICSEKCNNFYQCQTGCVFDKVDCDTFIKKIENKRKEINSIIENNFDFEKLHLSQENAIIRYISSVHYND